ncbi:MAG TPA: HD domain-containing protein [Tenuifilaceae bacterium]|nr:HD domain-containing protein [Tenuifilaceae bacterium]
MRTPRDFAIEKMNEIFRDIPYGIEHTMKVLSNAELIMESLEINDELKELISLTAILHDIGAVEAQKKYNSMEGKYQEIEGPLIAREILLQIDYQQSKINRICYIIGNHHSPSKIDGIDFEIQWDADLLENLAADEILNHSDKLVEYIENNFKTEKGKVLAYERFVNNS